MKFKFLLIFLLFSEAEVLKAQSKLPYSFCNCENNYDLETGNLSANNIFPFQVNLYLETKEQNVTYLKRKCDAIVLNENWLLSVASCFRNYEHQKDKILVGLPDEKNKKFNYEDIKDQPQIYTVDKVFFYPNYSEAGHFLEYKLFYNFATLKLKTSFKDDVFLKKIKPACLLLDHKIERDDKYFIIKKSSTCYQSRSYLNKEDIYYSSYEEHAFMLEHCHKDNVICLNSNSLDSCLKDFGTPLYLKKDSRIFVVGMHIGRNFLKKKKVDSL